MKFQAPPIFHDDLPQMIWVYGPRDGKALVYFSEGEPCGDPSVLEAIPHALMTTRACRRIAYFLNQAADKIEGKVVSINADQYETTDA